jgi:hypothetical protein
MVRKKLQNYTSGGVGGGGRDLPPCPTALGGARYMKIVAFDEIYNFVVQSFSI